MNIKIVTLIGGQLLALLVLVILQQIIPTEELKTWGWGTPFFFGALRALAALYLRRSLAESASEVCTVRRLGHFEHCARFVYGTPAGVGRDQLSRCSPQCPSSQCPS